MTHTLHRRGTPESLKGDFVVFAITCQTVNAKGSAPKFKKFADIVLKHNPLSFGDMRSGNKFNLSMDEINSSYRDNSIVHAVFNDEETVAAVLRELKETDLGVSVVVTGLLQQTAECCRAAELAPHTVECSLGIFGRTELLPREEVLEIGTMCGHGMVAFSLIEELAERVKSGGLTAEQAAVEMARQCQCGVFNPERAARILMQMTKQKVERSSIRAMRKSGSTANAPEKRFAEQGGRR